MVLGLWIFGGCFFAWFFFLNEDRNSSPYFPLKQRRWPVSEPTRLHTMPVTSPARGGVRALARGGETDRKKVPGFSALFSWSRWSPPWCKVSGVPTQKHMMGLWAPFGRACQHLPFLPLQPQEETALKTAAFPELFVLSKPFVARPPRWWKEQCAIWGVVLKEAFLSFPSQGGASRTRLSPFLWIIGNLFACPQGLHLLSRKRSRLLEAVRHWWQSTGAVFGFWWWRYKQQDYFFLYLGCFWSSEQWRVFICASKSYFQNEQCRSLCCYILIPLVCIYSYFSNKRNIF